MNSTLGSVVPLAMFSFDTEIGVADGNGTSGMSLLIQSLIIEQNVDRICLYLFHFQSNKAICNAKKFRKSNIPYLKN